MTRSRPSGLPTTAAKPSARSADRWTSTISRAGRCGAARPECGCQFSVTSGTIFASRKLSIRDYLAAIAIFTNGAKGHCALQLSRDLDCQYKTAFVLAHKLREAMADQDKGTTVSGEVEIDGMYVGGYVKPANHKENRRDRRLAGIRPASAVVIVARERERQDHHLCQPSQKMRRPDAA